MAGVAKWLRQWFVVPPFVGSSPIVRPPIRAVADRISLKVGREKTGSIPNLLIDYLDISAKFVSINQ